jgi:isoaspartyl peptidase/L-asparaginase-like protein (Ntn-hydrolase superfamily)
VGNGAILGADAWAKSLGAVAHASTPEQAILPTLQL